MRLTRVRRRPETSRHQEQRFIRQELSEVRKSATTLKTCMTIDAKYQVIDWILLADLTRRLVIFYQLEPHIMAQTFQETCCV